MSVVIEEARREVGGAHVHSVAGAETKTHAHDVAPGGTLGDVLHALTGQLRISRPDEQLGRMAIDELARHIPAQALAVHYLPSGQDQDTTYKYKVRRQPLLITSGDCPVTQRQFTRLIELGREKLSRGPYVANRQITARAEWPFPEVRQLVVAPLSGERNVFGHVAAFNHVEDADFTESDAKAMSSVGALLGIHSSNRELCRQQSDLLANLIRALVSAIDAKDPYTCGHSDRVARTAVRLGIELRCEPRLLNTVYMAGLLHDVGKIGISDAVLRKAGRLTEAEYEHIKIHPTMGHRILSVVKQLAEILPGVLHHHEHWNGSGYPRGLRGADIPRIARILAVADAYDAMTSERPYRQGMPIEKVDQILRQGAGRQWDPQVVDAYFRAHADIDEIRRQDRAQREFVEPEWA